MTLSVWQRRPLAADRSYDVAIVGGGIVGCSTAYWLRRLRPQLRVCIVDAGVLAGGASGRNAGFLLQGTSHDYITARRRYGPERARRLWLFTRENRDLILAELDSSSFGLETSGSMIVAGSERESERLREAVPLMRADGALVTFFPAEAVHQRLSARGFFGGLYEPSGAMLDPVRLVAHIAAESGADVLEHHPVHTLEPRGDTVLLETSRRHIRAGRVVLALNAYLPRLIPALSSLVRPVRAQMLVTEPLPERFIHLPVYSHEGYYYVRQQPDGTVLLGGARHLHREVEVGFEDAVTPSLQDDLEDYLRTHFPRANRARVQRRWSGTMGFSPDHLPLFGRVPGLDTCYWAAGFTGHGMGYGFRFGRLMAGVVDGRDQDDARDLFGVERLDDVAA